MSPGILSTIFRSFGRGGSLLHPAGWVASSFLVVSLLHAQATPEHLATSVLGRVTNARTGAAMARVLVQANGHALFTTAEGRFQFTDPNGIRTVQFTKPGFALSPEQRDPESVVINAPVAETSLDVELWPEAVLTGTVTSPDDDPLPHISVTARRSLFQNGVHQTFPLASTLTDVHGSFRIPVPAGSYVLETRYAAPNLARNLAVLPMQMPARTAEDRSGTISIASGQELHFDLHPQQATVYHVTVPIDAATASRSPSITVMTATGAAYQPPRRVTPEGLELDLAAGVYQLSARVPTPDGDRVGQVVLTVPDHDLVSAPLPLDPVVSIPVVVTVDPAVAASTAGASTPPDASGLNLQLEPSGGTAFESDGEPLHLNRRGLGRSSFTLPPGAYRLSAGESAGWTIVSANYGGVDLLRQSFSVGSNVGAEPIRIVVAAANGSVSGITLRDGVPTSCWIVVVADGGTLPRFFVRRSENAGAFTVSGLPFKRFHLLALPVLPTADFGDQEVLNAFQIYVQTVAVTASSSAPLTLQAVPIHELYP